MKKILICIFALIFCLSIPMMATACKDKTDPATPPSTSEPGDPQGPGNSESNPSSPSEEGDNNPSEDDNNPSEDDNNPSETNPNNPNEGDSNPSESESGSEGTTPGGEETENPEEGSNPEENPDGGHEGGSSEGEDVNNPGGNEGDDNQGTEGGENQGQGSEETPTEPPVNPLKSEASQTLSAWVGNELFPFELVDVVEITESTAQNFSFTFTTSNVEQFKLALYELVRLDATFNAEGDRFVKTEGTVQTIIQITDGDIMTFHIYTEEVAIEDQSELFFSWFEEQFEVDLRDAFTSEIQIFDLEITDSNMSCKILGDGATICDDLANYLNGMYMGGSELVISLEDFDLPGVITVTIGDAYTTFTWAE